jgi:hypothetical protein
MNKKIMYQNGEENARKILLKNGKNSPDYIIFLTQE